VYVVGLLSLEARIQQDSDHPSRNPHNSVCDVESIHSEQSYSVNKLKGEREVAVLRINNQGERK